LIESEDVNVKDEYVSLPSGQVSIQLGSANSIGSGGQKRPTLLAPFGVAPLAQIKSGVSLNMEKEDSEDLIIKPEPNEPSRRDNVMVNTVRESNFDVQNQNSTSAGNIASLPIPTSLQITVDSSSRSANSLRRNTLAAMRKASIAVSLRNFAGEMEERLGRMGGQQPFDKSYSGSAFLKHARSLPGGNDSSNSLLNGEIVFRDAIPATHDGWAGPAYEKGKVTTRTTGRRTVMLYNPLDIYLFDRVLQWKNRNPLMTRDEVWDLFGMFGYAV
jgi:hypothetical protein